VQTSRHLPLREAACDQEPCAARKANAKQAVRVKVRESTGLAARAGCVVSPVAGENVPAAMPRLCKALKLFALVAFILSALLKVAGVA
jgi:hypothetical protein